MWWEFGEHVTYYLSPFAWLVSRVWKCRCEARRRWLNEQGENLWAAWQPLAHDDLHAGFEDVVLTQCRIVVQTSVALHAKLGPMGLGVSENTCVRWLDDLVAEGKLASLVMSGLRYYGLPAESIVTSSKHCAKIG